MASTMRAHPRSRGENRFHDRGCRDADGSSPLTRGKLVCVLRAASNRGLIPAHAGKTRAFADESSGTAAHPRSRGENTTRVIATFSDCGSSPLTRGKPTLVPADLPKCRLIPAHAGKTESRGAEVNVSQAHPRSRGENKEGTVIKNQGLGSSPLTRGKRRPCGWPARCARLIPAHAGKTRSSAAHSTG